ncbi:MAG: DNA oxidative demethylase AlkB [Acidobacteria bacterium]|nr:DNA oxidative demethylase AlkB [Acidobacteriota bacterium]
MRGLFEDENPAGKEEIVGGAFLLRAFALAREAALLAAVEAIAKVSPFRHMITPGGFRMSVAMTNCGGLGWITDRRGYRYDAIDPETGRKWPAMPPEFSQLAVEAAGEAGFSGFHADACLINRYAPGTRLTLHQDKNEQDYTAPIVSVSLGVPATFLFGGIERGDKARRILVTHGDVVVWGGPARLRYHGIAPLKAAQHPKLGEYRINLTFRKAG